MAALPELHSRSIWRNPNAEPISADEQLRQLVNAWAQNDPTTREVSVQVADVTDLLPPLANLVAQYAMANLPKSVVAWHEFSRHIYPEGLRMTPLPANIVAILRSPLSLAEQQEFGATNLDGSVKRVCDVFHLCLDAGESPNILEQRLEDYNARYPLHPHGNVFRLGLDDMSSPVRRRLWNTCEQPGWALVSDIVPGSKKCDTELLRARLNAMNCDFLSSLPLACSFAFTQAITGRNPFLNGTAESQWISTCTRVAANFPIYDFPIYDFVTSHVAVGPFCDNSLKIATCHPNWNDSDTGSCAVRRWNNPA